MRVNSNRMRSVDMESTTGQTENNTMASGATTKCTVKVPSSGKIKRSTKDHSSMISAKERVLSVGPMVDNTSENGRQVNNTVEEHT